jgi:predicted AAA+ superfamily ATPase
MNPVVRANPARFLRQDIVDKVPLKDLPSLYGIGDTQELNRFFNVLAFTTGNEVSLEALSQHSAITKAKLNDYMEYLEAAYLIRRVHRIDDNALRLQRARHRLARAPLVTTRTVTTKAELEGMTIEFLPVALHCYTIARNLLRGG